MSTINREKILTGLRLYHSNVFPDVPPSKEAASLQKELEELEDAVGGMLLKLINGKASFVDYFAELNILSKKATKLLPAKDAEYKNLFLSKIDQLQALLVIAKESTFKLRPVRVAKTQPVKH